MLTDMKIDISIIIVNWNTKNLLYNCIKSIYDTTYKFNFEIIVVDNGSSDGSQEMVSKSFPRVILIENHENIGFAAANNMGIRKSSGTNICLINSDIVLLAGCLDSLNKYLNRNIEVGMVGPKLLNADHSLQVSCKRQPNLWNNFCLAIGLNNLLSSSKYFCGEHLLNFNYNEIINSEAIVGAFILARKSAINEVGLMDENFFFYGEEIDWCKRFWDKGYKVRFFPYAKSIHFGAGSTSKEPLKFYKQLYISKLVYYNKHYKRHYRNVMIILQITRQILRIIATKVRPNRHINDVYSLPKETEYYKYVISYLWYNLKVK